MNLIPIFLTGFSVGGLTCLAVQGGLLATQISGKRSFVPTAAFLLAKLAAYTLLGILLGLFGSVINISSSAQAIMQLLAGLYMLAVALNLLELHPVFRYAVIQPPRFLSRWIRKESKSEALFAPAVLGAMTIFIPCGTTLAMEALAISSASAFTGGLIMFAFILGTIPVFSIVGALTAMLSNSYKQAFLKFAAVLIIFLGLSSINGSLVSLGSPLAFKASPKSAPAAPVASASQDVAINITSRGYSPDYFRVQSGKPVNVTVTNTGAYSCASAFRIPDYGIAANLRPGQSKTFTFTPARPGQITFSCSMGMYTGVIEAI